MVIHQMVSHLRARALLFIVVLACLATGCTKEARRDRHLKRANAYYEARQLEKAAIEYINAFRLDPKSAVCASRLATVYYEEGQLIRALPLLAIAQERDPKDIEVRIKLARIFNEAQAVPKARELAADILGKQPTNEEAWLLLSGTALTPEEIAEVEQRMGQVRSQLGDRDHSALYLAAGMLRLRQKELDKAELAFKKAYSLNPKSFSSCRALASVYFLRGKVDEARQEHEKEIQLVPHDLFARLRFAEFNLRNGALDEARGRLAAIRKEAPDFVPAQTFLAALAFETKRYDECASLVTKILSQSPGNYRALSIRGGLSMVHGDVKEAIEEFKGIKNLYGRVPEVHLQLARAYLATNDVENALSALEQAVIINPNFTEALLLKGGIGFKKGDYAMSVSVFSQLVRQNPTMAVAQFYLADALRARGTLDDALVIYRRLTVAYPTNAEIPYLTGRVYRQQRKPKEAEQAFAKALELNPVHLSALNQWVELKIQQKDYPSARQLLDETIGRTPRVSEAWFMRAKLASAQGDVADTETALLKALELDSESMAASVALAKLYLDSNRGEQAIRKLDEILARSPNNLPALMQEAHIHEKLNHYAKAAERYERILSIAPRFGLVLNNLAYLYHEHLSRLDRANELALKARELLPDSPEIADTLGWILYKKREYGRAAALLAEAAAKLSSSAEVQFHLGMALYWRGIEKDAKDCLERALRLGQNFSGADEARERLALLDGDASASDPRALARLQGLLDKQPEDPIGLMRLAELHTRSEAWEKARATYEKLLKLTPQSVPTLLKLASLYAEKLNDPRRALELVKQGQSLAPNDPQVSHTCGRLAFLGGNHQWAVGVFQEAVQKQPPQPDLLYDFAWALYSIGQTAEAHENMRQSLKLDPDFPHAALAKQFLFMTALATNLKVSPQAGTAAESLLKSDPGNVPALMILGNLQTQQGSNSAARQTYEKILNHYPRFSPALKALVILPGGTGNDRRDFELASLARKALPEDALVAKALGRALFKRGDFASARSLLQQAVRARADDAEAHYYLGLSSCKLGNQKQGKADLKRASELGLSGEHGMEATRILLEAK